MFLNKVFRKTEIGGVKDYWVKLLKFTVEKDQGHALNFYINI